MFWTFFCFNTFSIDVDFLFISLAGRSLDSLNLRVVFSIHSKDILANISSKFFLSHPIDSFWKHLIYFIFSHLWPEIFKLSFFNFHPIIFCRVQVVSLAVSNMLFSPSTEFLTSNITFQILHFLFGYFQICLVIFHSSYFFILFSIPSIISLKHTEHTYLLSRIQ